MVGGAIARGPDGIAAIGISVATVANGAVISGLVLEGIHLTSLVMGHLTASVTLWHAKEIKVSLKLFLYAWVGLLFVYILPLCVYFLYLTFSKKEKVFVDGRQSMSTNFAREIGGSGTRDRKAKVMKLMTISMAVWLITLIVAAKINKF